MKTITEKLCRGCLVVLPIDNFLFSKRDGYLSKCKECRNAYARQKHTERKLNPEYRARKNQLSRESRLRNPRSNERRRKEWLKGLYKMTPEQYNNMLIAQNYICAVCQQPCKTERGLAVDHDHSCCPGNKSCGKCIRGLLCINCNRGLGMFQDDPVLLNRAIDYLAKF
jgi:hypothetical protein